jgi:hypothetical protein
LCTVLLTEQSINHSRQEKYAEINHLCTVLLTEQSINQSGKECVPETTNHAVHGGRRIYQINKGKSYYYLFILVPVLEKTNQ